MTRLVAIALILACGLAAAAEPKDVPPFPRIEMKTSLGSFVLELDGRRSPRTVANFVEYVREGHYDGTIFHRVIQGFVAQGGGYDAEYRERPTREPVVNESGNGLSNRRGTIAMARTSAPHSATSQFYVNLGDNAQLDPNGRRWGYCVFGEVVEGMEVIDKIAAVATGPGGSFRSDVPQEAVIIESAKLLR